jgi:hypothetical protein
MGNVICGPLASVAHCGGDWHVTVTARAGGDGGSDGDGVAEGGLVTGAWVRTGVPVGVIGWTVPHPATRALTTSPRSARRMVAIIGASRTNGPTGFSGTLLQPFPRLIPVGPVTPAEATELRLLGPGCEELVTKIASAR